MSNALLKGVNMYDPNIVQPMREELTSIGVQELASAEAVDSALDNAQGTALLVINSVCGCAAGSCRPSVAIAMQHHKTPDKAYTVFAGQDKEATQQARSYFQHIPPSSPSIFLLKDGEVVYAVERHMIEGRTADQIAQDITSAFDEFC